VGFRVRSSLRCGDSADRRTVEPFSFEIFDNPDMANKYLICPRNKARNKKHIDICKQCRYRKNCTPYRKYRQPELPFKL
jgi:hypothetical protein